MAKNSCPSCEGKGWYWVHEDGTKRDPLPSEDPSEFYRHECSFLPEECQWEKKHKTQGRVPKLKHPY